MELAIDVVANLNRPECRHRLEAAPLYDGRRFGPDDRIVLVCAGYVEGILEEVLAEAGLRLKADA